VSVVAQLVYKFLCLASPKENPRSPCERSGVEPPTSHTAALPIKVEQWAVIGGFCARFDRELLFPLPSHQARASIINIHTRKWAQPPSQEVKAELANLCVGYCGADLKVPPCALLPEVLCPATL